MKISIGIKKGLPPAPVANDDGTVAAMPDTPIAANVLTNDTGTGIKVVAAWVISGAGTPAFNDTQVIYTAEWTEVGSPATLGYTIEDDYERQDSAEVEYFVNF